MQWTNVHGNCYYMYLAAWSIGSTMATIRASTRTRPTAAPADVPILMSDLAIDIAITIINENIKIISFTIWKGILCRHIHVSARTIAIIIINVSMHYTHTHSDVHAYSTHPCMVFWCTYNRTCIHNYMLVSRFPLLQRTGDFDWDCDYLLVYSVLLITRNIITLRSIRSILWCLTEYEMQDTYITCTSALHGCLTIDGVQPTGTTDASLCSDMER